MSPIMRFKVKDKSMEPVLREGDYILANKLFFSLGKGDVVIARRNNRFFIKRIKRIGRNKYFLCGDNAGLSSDFWADKSNIVGKVLLHIRR